MILKFSFFFWFYFLLSYQKAEKSQVNFLKTSAKTLKKSLLRVYLYQTALELFNFCTSFEIEASKVAGIIQSSKRPYFICLLAIENKTWQ